MNINQIGNDILFINQNIQGQERKLENADKSNLDTAVFIEKNQNTNNLENQLKDSLKNQEELKKVIEELQRRISYLNKSLKIELNDEIKEPVVKIIDINTNQIIRQIPPDYIINIIKNINKILGALVNEKV